MTRRAGVHLTAEQIAEAKVLFSLGWSYPRLGERFGCDYKTVKLALDADYARERRMQVNSAARLRRAPYKRIGGRENATAISVKEDGAARLAEVPPDTRTLTQRLMGDPIPADPRRARLHL
ncbi:hypothetical protein NKI61_19870 [Mesorhizobium sp. M0514]|uniref:hypothetical protein n=1 Tax=Mesorhizobium sp. M0514 TaxID=2956955 RepID=UPI00333D526D